MCCYHTKLGNFVHLMNNCKCLMILAHGTTTRYEMIVHYTHAVINYNLYQMTWLLHTSYMVTSYFVTFCKTIGTFTWIRKHFVTFCNFFKFTVIIIHTSFRNNSSHFVKLEVAATIALLNYTPTQLIQSDGEPELLKLIQRPDVLKLLLKSIQRPDV